MPDYDFKSLSPIDFEVLVRDLLQEELKIRLESFKSGRDSGIDFRYSPTADESTIVQCKHYVESSYRVLIRQLRNHELEKVKKINPKRYILATSIGLNPNQKQQIAELLNPFVVAVNDIYSKDDLNNLLGRFPKIEKQTFKLWFASVPAFEEILHIKVKNVSKEVLEKIREHAKYYVQNDSFPDALRMLDEHNFCIIAGIPGIGKTTLAEMLLLHFVERGYEIIKIEGDISEASAFDYTNQRRVFYYDDFLGQTSFSEKLNKNEDQKLLDFMHAIKCSKVSKLILTTREYILNQARMGYEKLSRDNFVSETYLIYLSKYTRLVRARILFNRIYFSNLPSEYKKALLRKRNYLKIIDHENYNPRIIDIMTHFSKISDTKSGNYFSFFISNLENPLEIWKHAYEHQLLQESKNLLIVLASMPSEVFLEDLQEAFWAFHRKQANEYGFGIKSDDFMRAVKELEGNFISSETSNDQTIIRFHNPSIRDFVENHLASNEAEIHGILQSARFYNQLVWLWEFQGNNSLVARLRETILKHTTDFLSGLRGTMGSRSCRLITSRDFDGKFSKRVWDISFEARVALVASVTAQLKSKEAKDFLDELLLVVENHIDTEGTNLEDLVQLLGKLRKLRFISSDQQDPLLDKTKALLLYKPEWIVEFKPLCNFAESFPELFTENETNAMRQDFQDVARENVDTIMSASYTSDPNIVRNDADELKYLADRLGIDVKVMVEELEARADDLEANAPSEQDESKNTIRSNKNEIDCSDQDIESLFSILK